MEKTLNPVGLIKTICGKLRDEKFENIAEVENEIQLLGEYLGTGTMQTVIFSAIYDRCAGGSYSDIDDLARYFECTSLDIVSHKRELEEMLIRGLIELANDKMQFIRYQFKVSDPVFDAIIDGKAIGECKQACRALDQFEFVRTVGAWVENREDEHVSSSGLYAMVSDLEKKYSSCEFVCKVRELVPAIDDRILFYDTCKDSYFDDRNTDLETTFKDIIDNQKELLQKMKTFIEESSELHKLDLIKTWKDDDEYKMKPSRQGYELFLGEFAECKLGTTRDLDKFEFVKTVYDFVQARKRENYSVRRLAGEVRCLERDNSCLNIVRQARKLIEHSYDRVFYYYLCNEYLSGRTYLDSALQDIYDKQNMIMEQTVRWQNEEHILQTRGLAELGEQSFFGSSRVELTEDGLEVFLDDDFEKYRKKDKTNDLLRVDRIKEKNLYYSQDLDREISFLRDSIGAEAFARLQARLEEQALPTGVAAIFYGLPGTGKTETVYQLAKASGRDVMQVDISEMKTCWYGESQKLVKGVFTKYEKLCRKSKNLPILLFNEADAIFGKRLEDKHSSVDQTENAIQNIILEQMEKQKGILIATTNLESSLDPAFERRFLFKIKFERPGVEAKKHIWMDKLSGLNEDAAGILAENYNLSGGEIDNVVRKVTMNRVLTGEDYSLDYLKELCSQEKFSKQQRVVGF
ncbi:MAG: ATP-binding protein [Candidatus Cryptobacteroides sp.]